MRDVRNHASVCGKVKRRWGDVHHGDDAQTGDDDSQGYRYLPEFNKRGKIRKEKYGDQGGTDQGMPDKPKLFLDFGEKDVIQHAEHGIDKKSQEEGDAKSPGRTLHVVLKESVFQVSVFSSEGERQTIDLHRSGI